MMRTLWLLVAVGLVNSSPAVTAQQPMIETPTIFMVNLEPQKYAGKTVRFDKAILLGGFVMRGDFIELQVFNDKKAKPNHLDFTTSKKIANSWAEEGYTTSMHFPVKLTCTMALKGDRGLAIVTQIDILDSASGKVVKSYKD